MYWPKLRLTPDEAIHVGKYADSRVGKKKPGVVRRAYPGTLILSATNRLPTYNFAVARRARIFALTFAGDLNAFLLQIQDATGEVVNMSPLSTTHFGTGANDLPYGTFGSPPVPGPVFPGSSNVPFIFDPNLLLLPNQTISVNGSSTAGDAVEDARLDFVLHAWEFPGMEGSPDRG